MVAFCHSADDADTKDFRDAGIDVVYILAGRVIPLRLGHVPVVNRGQRDIDTSKPIQEALDAERSFFEHNPAHEGKAQYCGTPSWRASLTWFMRTLKR